MQSKDTEEQFIAPSPNGEMEAAWLVWPWPQQQQRNPDLYSIPDLEPTYMQIVEGLQKSKDLLTRIIFKSQSERQRVEKRLSAFERVELFVIPVDDIWIRDNGPCFVRDQKGSVHVLAWGFNGWGGKTISWDLDKEVSFHMAKQLELPLIDLTKQFTTEGGAHQFDGNGLLIATECSILNPNRNQEVNREDVQKLFRKYYGIKKFIWLQGEAGNSCTDMHIDGYVRIANEDTLLSYSKQELRDICFTEQDIEKIYSASNCEGKPFEIIEVPVSQNLIKVIFDPNDNSCIQRHGSYLNFFKANNVVLVPTYNDPNDKVAVEMFEKIFPECSIVPIDCVDLYSQGGMLHCITQQQPISLNKKVGQKQNRYFCQ